jgi:hypothetical protein
MSFLKSGEQESKTGLVWWLVQGVWGGYKERVEEGECGGNVMYSCMKMEKWTC